MSNCQINVVIPNEMKEWLDKHPEINRSELFRNAVNAKKNITEQKISPLMFLASIMGIIMSISLIGIATTPYLSVPIRAVLSLLGGILAVTTIFVYIKETRDIKKHQKEIKGKSN